MALDRSKVAFVSGPQYMRKFSDYTLPSGGGSVTHGLGYPPYFQPFAIESGQDYLISLHTGNMIFPSGDLPFYIVETTNTQITITEDIAPVNPTTYFIRVYEDPLP